MSRGSCCTIAVDGGSSACRLTPALAARLRREAENEALPPYVSSFIGYEAVAHRRVRLYRIRPLSAGLPAARSLAQSLWQCRDRQRERYHRLVRCGCVAQVGMTPPQATIHADRTSSCSRLASWSKPIGGWCASRKTAGHDAVAVLAPASDRGAEGGGMFPSGIGGHRSDQRAQGVGGAGPSRASRPLGARPGL